MVSAFFMVTRNYYCFIEQGSRIRKINIRAFWLANTLLHPKEIHALIVCNRKEPAIKFFPGVIVFNVLHHSNKYILCHVIGILFMSY